MFTEGVDCLFMRYLEINLMFYCGPHMTFHAFFDIWKVPFRKFNRKFNNKFKKNFVSRF